MYNFEKNKDSIVQFIDKIYYVKKVKLNKNKTKDIIKRCFDFILSTLGIILLLIPAIIISIAIKLDSKGSIIYRQDRLGLNGKEFTLYKFRSMYEDAEKEGPKWADKKDNRVTKVGRILRRTRLDEIPNLLNILLGDLSFVGPRPERKFFYEKFDEYIKGFDQRLLVKPGLTGLAQIRGGYDLKPEEKIVFDVLYMENRNLLIDISIIFNTFSLIFFGKVES